LENTNCSIPHTRGRSNKKQIKLTSLSQEEVNEIVNKTNITDYVDNQLISRVIDTDSKTYKDVRKISIGISKRDITSYRCKKRERFIIALFNFKNYT